MKKTVSTFFTILCLLSTVFLIALAFNVQPAKASGTIYIRADGSIDPPDAPIQRDGSIYTLTGNIRSDADGIVVERSNIIVDGLDHTVQGVFGIGIDLTGRSNVTIKNMRITAFFFGIILRDSYNNIISGNSIENKWGDGIVLYDSSNNNIAGNNITNNNEGIFLQCSSRNIISGNNVANNEYGIWLYASRNNNISGNMFINDGLVAYDSYDNIVEDNLVNGKPLVYLEGVSDLRVEDAGQVILVKCNSIIIENLNLSHTDVGIELWQTKNTRITNNNIKNNLYDGIQLSHSSNNNIAGNNITNNNEYGAVLYDSSYNTVSGNSIANNNDKGITIGGDHNTVSGNSIANNGDGILISGSYNIISGNQIINNDDSGIEIFGGPFTEDGHNTVFDNNIANNNVGLGIGLAKENSIYHNNFLNNTEQAYFDSHGATHYGKPIIYFNAWDDGYPSGGNYWSNYNGTDSYSGAYQNESGSDGIGDTPYLIHENNQDNYPLMSPWTPSEHELIVTITAPTFMRVGDSISLVAIITNEGLNEEAAVELELLINGAVVDSATISTLKPYFPHTLSYLWTLTNVGTYNVTAYAHPVGGETSVENNQVTKTVIVGPPLEVGVKAGDWIKCDYTTTGAPSGIPLPTWIRLEFLSVEGTTATARVTLHMSDGTEQNETMNVDVVAGSGTIGTFSGFLIPANSATGYPIYMSGYGDLQIAGETTRTYAGASRTVVYTSFSQYGTQLTYYWDKQTGVMVEASTKMGRMTSTAKVTETNMWEAAPFWMQWWLWAIVVVVIVVSAGAVYLKKRKLPTTPLPPESAEQSE